MITENLGGYVTTVRKILHETNAAKSTHTNEFIKDIFNLNYRRRCAELVMEVEGHFVDIALRNIEADEPRYATPPGFERMLKLELVRSDGRTIPVQRWERHYTSNYPSTSGADDFYPTYRPIGSSIVLEPTPDTDVTNGLRMEYVGVPAQLEDDGDELHADFPKIFASLLIYDTVIGLVDSESLLENGAIKSVLRGRAEYQQTWERYITSRFIPAQNQIEPMSGHYQDA